jgi:hypothetical protein
MTFANLISGEILWTSKKVSFSDLDLNMGYVFILLIRPKKAYRLNRKEKKNSKNKTRPLPYSRHKTNQST